MPDYVRNAYGSNTIPPEDTLEHLMRDLQNHLRRHKKTPDEWLVERILSRRGIGSERELVRLYGAETLFAAFMREYQGEIEGDLNPISQSI